MVTIKQMIRLGREVAAWGLVQGAGGNISFLKGETLRVTCSGAWLERLSAEDFVPVHLDEPRETLLARQPRPTSEASMHQAAYKVRPEARVIIHAHPPQALVMGMLNLALPAMTPDGFLHLGAVVPVLPYITPTTQALADVVAEMMVNRPVIMLQNHGVLVTGPTLDEARLRLRLLEEQCGIYLQARAVSPGGPRILSPDDMDALHTLTGGKYRYE